MIINTKDIKKHKTGPCVDNIFYTIKPDDKYSNIGKKFAALGIFTELKHNNLIIEIPHTEREIIKTKDLLKSDEYQKTKYSLPLIMGLDVFGDVVIKDLDMMPHLLVTGRVGSGKTVFLKNIYESLSNSDCQFLIIDTKNVDFNGFNKKKNLFMPVVSDVDRAIRTLDIVTEIIDERYVKFSDMPCLIVMIDEFADLMYKNKRITEAFIQYIAQKGRAVGVHLIIATQKTEKKVLSDLIMANIPTKIVFKTRDKKQSVRILGESGAELLLPFGDMLYSEAGRPPLRIHVGI